MALFINASEAANGLTAWAIYKKSLVILCKKPLSLIGIISIGIVLDSIINRLIGLVYNIIVEILIFYDFSNKIPSYFPRTLLVLRGWLGDISTFSISYITLVLIAKKIIPGFYDDLKYSQKSIKSFVFSYFLLIKRAWWPLFACYIIMLILQIIYDVLEPGLNFYFLTGLIIVIKYILINMPVCPMLACNDILANGVTCVKPTCVKLMAIFSYTKKFLRLYWCDFWVIMTVWIFICFARVFLINDPYWWLHASIWSKFTFIVSNILITIYFKIVFSLMYFESKRRFMNYEATEFTRKPLI